MCHGQIKIIIHLHDIIDYLIRCDNRCVECRCVCGERGELVQGSVITHNNLNTAVDGSLSISSPVAIVSRSQIVHQ